MRPWCNASLDADRWAWRSIRSALDRASVSLLLAIASLLPLACVSSGGPLGVGSPLPPDLAINATVIRGESAAAADRVELRDGRWLLLPDGSLRAMRQGEGSPSPSGRPDHGVRPGEIRRLRESESEELWRLAGRLGLADPRNANASAAPATLEAGPREIVQVVEFQAQGQSWAFVSRRPAASGGDPALGEIIRALAERAWMADRPAELEPGAAIRYDFGPDPYAPYRRQGSGAAGSSP